MLHVALSARPPPHTPGLVVEKIDPCFQQTLEMRGAWAGRGGGAGGGGLLAPAVESRAPSPTFELGIISSSLPLGPEPSRRPSLVLQGRFHSGFGGSEARTKGHLIHTSRGHLGMFLGRLFFSPFKCKFQSVNCTDHGFLRLGVLTTR